MPQIKRTRERKDLFFLFRRCKGDRSFLRAKNLVPSFALRRAKPYSSYSVVKRSPFCARKNLPRLLHCDEQSLIFSYSAAVKATALFCARKILPRLLHCDGQSPIPLIPPLRDLFFVREKSCPVFYIATSKALFFLVFLFFFLLFRR